MLNPADVPEDITLCLIAVNDDSIEKITRILPTNSIWIHTSGTVSIEVLSRNPRRGVVYPLQTFSRKSPYPQGNFPVFIEASDPFAMKLVRSIAERLTDKVITVDSQTRLKIHVAGVISCNFTNYLWNIAYRLLDDYTLDFSILQPLVIETLNKAGSGYPPIQFQTGPAARNDRKTIDKHLSVLKDSDRETYNFLTDKIIKELNEGYSRKDSIGK